jgi:AAA domain
MARREGLLSVNPNGHGQPRLPQVTQDYLAHGAPEGQRNKALFDAAVQFRDARYSFQEAIDQLLPVAMDNGLARTKAAGTIKSAYNHSPRDPIGQGNGQYRPDLRGPGRALGPAPKPVYRPIQVEAQPHLPPALCHADEAAIAQLEQFPPEAFIAIGYRYETVDKEGKIELPITGGVVRTRESWIADIKQRGLDEVLPCDGEEEGIFVRVNPMQDANGKKNKDVASYAAILIEADQGALEEQWAKIQKIGLPIRWAVFSGDRSVNAVLVIDAPNEDAYRERYELVSAFCEQALGLKLDPANKNPSRYTRLAGARRTLRDHGTNEKILDSEDGPLVVERELLAINIPGLPWEQWVKSLPVEGKPPRLSGRTVLDFLDIEIDPKTNLAGNRWLTTDGSAFVIAPSGHGKSSLAMQLTICWALGRVVFGIKPARPLRILIVQSEDDDAETKKFVQMIRTLKLSQDELALLRENTRFEFQRTISSTNGQFW